MLQTPYVSHRLDSLQSHSCASSLSIDKLVSSPVNKEASVATRKDYVYLLICTLSKDVLFVFCLTTLSVNQNVHRRIIVQVYIRFSEILGVRRVSEFRIVRVLGR